MVASPLSFRLALLPAQRTRRLRRYGLVAAIVALVGALPAESAVTASGAASWLVGSDVSIACTDLSQQEWWGAAEIGVPHIELDHDVCDVLAAAPRLRRGYGLQPSTGASVLTLAHEAAHVRGVEDEREADCFGLANLHRTALWLGYRAAQLPRLEKQAQAVSTCP